jgi:hypothetical protein
MSWSARADWGTVRRRASGRRRYNAWRQSMALYRRVQVLALLGQLGWRPGVQAAIARRLHVSGATMSRDFRVLFAERDPRPDIGGRDEYGLLTAAPRRSPVATL